MIIEIKRPPNRMGNSKRLYIEVTDACTQEVTEEIPIGNFPFKQHIAVRLEVTPKEFAEYTRLAKAQETRRKQEQEITPL
jgi:hypothetical protein